MMKRMAFQNFFRRFARLGAIMATFFLIPEAIFFFALAVWKASRFIGSVRDDGAPAWYLLISSIGLLTGAVFCLVTCRRLLRKKVQDDAEAAADAKELEPVARESRFVRRIGKIWLSLAFSICVFVLPPLLFFMGLVLDRKNEAEWLIGVPIGIALVIYFFLLPYRWRGKNRDRKPERVTVAAFDRFETCLHHR